MKRLAVFALVAGLAGCSEAAPTRIDGSSPEAFARTTTAARRDLPVADRLMFDAAIATMPSRRYADHDPQAKARVAFDGMTAADVVATERERAP
jgi:hypothetical protein